MPPDKHSSKLELKTGIMKQKLLELHFVCKGDKLRKIKGDGKH